MRGGREKKERRELWRASAEKDARREGETERGRVERKKKEREIKRKKLTKLVERQSEREKKS